MDDTLTHRAAQFVSFVSQHKEPQANLTRLGFVCVKALSATEKGVLTRLVQLEDLVAQRYTEAERGGRALAREQRRLDRELRRLEEKRDALNAYHAVLTATGNENGNE